MYADDRDFDATRNTVIILLRFVAIYSFFDAMAIIFGSAVRAAGDTIFSMLMTCACAWGLLVIPTYLTWKLYRPDLLISWLWCSLYVITLGFAFLGRFMSGKWMTMSIIDRSPESDSPEAPDQSKVETTIA